MLMRISYQWLQDYIDLGSDMTPERLAELLTAHGIPVEVIEPMNKGISGVVVGHVLEVNPHPNADRLRVCTVDIGKAEKLQIVCGAPNVAPTQKVPCATIGAHVFDRHTGEAMKIKRSKLRGVESQGMLCSADEIGLDTKLLPKAQTEGLYLLPEDSPVGEDISTLLGLSDVSLELELTPNRADCLSFRGVAYEVAAILDKKVKFDNEDDSIDFVDEKSPVTVRIESEHCTHYAAQVVRGVKVGPSPLWLQMRLLAVGVRPINNIVDVTNYVMFEYGQPLHAFDLSQVSEKTIVVRQAREGETLITLDGQERLLDPSMLVIADTKRAIGLAGVMGGENSEVRENTVDIVLESAYFDPASTRNTGKRLGLRSEAQMRFEKGVDRAGIRPALIRAAQMITELCGGELVGEPVEVVQEEVQPLTVSLRLSRINDMLGTSLGEQEVESVLGRLNFSYNQSGNAHWEVNVPTRRGDISREIDLIEEVARLYGYDKIPTTMPEGIITQGLLTEEQKLRRMIRSLLIGAGLTEVYTYTLTNPSWLEALQLETGSSLLRQVPLMMPMSEERKVLRTTMLPALAEVALYNVKRKNTNVALFEIGKIYVPKSLPIQELPEERHVIAGFFTGAYGIESVGEKTRPVDFFTVKGIVEHLLQGIGIENPRYEQVQRPGLHPGRTAVIKVKDYELGIIGGLHPDVEEAWDLPESYYFELDFLSLVQSRDPQVTVKPLPKFPAVERDVAILVKDEVPAGALFDTIWREGSGLIEEVKLFDVYRGEQVPAGMKSIAYSIVYRSEERTLTDEEVNERHAAVIAALEREYGAELR
jgi:phenylalanyl-tRNA synthetase beta chain